MEHLLNRMFFQIFKVSLIILSFLAQIIIK